MSKNAVIYARYSSDRQREESIEGQVRECLAFAKREKLTIINTYTDRALSAKTDNRPEFKKMIQDSSKGAFEYVLVYQLDRFSRNRYDSATYKAKLKKNGVKVISAKENITDDPSGIILESVLEGMAEYYSAELSVKVTRGMTENALKGIWPGGNPSLGYRIAPNKRLELDPLYAPAVAKMFELYISGTRMQSIANILNAQGYRRPSGKPFDSQSISTILDNEKYTGVFKWKDIRIEDCYPPIISKAIYNKVKELRKLRHKNKNSKSEIYELCTKIKCGKCGAAYIGTSATSANGNIHYYYTCYNRRKLHTCDAKNLRQADIEDLVINNTIKMLQNEEIVSRIAKQAVATQKTDDNTALIEQLHHDIKATKKELNNYIEAIASGINALSLKAAMESAENRLVELELTLSQEQLKKENEFILTENHVLFFLHKIIDGDSNSAKVRQKIIDTFIRQVSIYDGFVEIAYNYKNELPVLTNKQILKSSFSSGLVDDDRIELPTSCL